MDFRGQKTPYLFSDFRKVKEAVRRGAPSEIEDKIRAALQLVELLAKATVLSES